MFFYVLLLVLLAPKHNSALSMEHVERPRSAERTSGLVHPISPAAQRAAAASAAFNSANSPASKVAARARKVCHSTVVGPVWCLLCFETNERTNERTNEPLIRACLLLCALCWLVHTIPYVCTSDTYVRFIHSFRDPRHVTERHHAGSQSTFTFEHAGLIAACRWLVFLFFNIKTMDLVHRLIDRVARQSG